MKAAVPGVYVPRQDQVAAVIARSGCSREQAIEVCQANYRTWRDTPRKWISVRTRDNGWFVVEDR